MSEEIPVYDEWGNYIGKFIPSNSDSIFFLIGLVFLWTIGFVIFLFFRFTIKGIKEALEGNFLRSFLNLLVPISMILIGSTIYYFDISTYHKERVLTKQYELLSSGDIDKLFSVIKVKNGDYDYCSYYISEGLLTDPNIYKLENHTKTLKITMEKPPIECYETSHHQETHYCCSKNVRNPCFQINYLDVYENVGEISTLIEEDWLHNDRQICVTY